MTKLRGAVGLFVCVVPGERAVIGPIIGAACLTVSWLVKLLDDTQDSDSAWEA